MPVITEEKPVKDFIHMSLKISLILLACFSIVACQKDSTSTTDFFTPVNVNTNVDLTFAQYSSLNLTQGYAYLTGGNRGIILYHTIDDQFVAFDRTCPVNPEKSCAMVSMDSVPVRYRCGYPDTGSWKICCHSLFDAASGVQISGEAKRGLKMYYTAKRGNVVYISSTPF